MSGETAVDRRAARRQGTMAEIVAAAWALARADGLAALSMRELGKRVGMRAQSIYSYFGSKNEIYDAMFLEGCTAFDDHMAAAADTAPFASHPVGAATAMARAYVDFCTTDPARYQLLFQRPVPDFTPSERSYAVAVASYAQMERQLATIGVRGQDELDLWTAMLTGLTSQQLSNDPGGDRWTRLVDRAVALLVPDTSHPIEGNETT